jgi:ATP citrate (pro-S)-lyase
MTDAPQLDIERLRQLEPVVVAIGSHRQIIQSMLDFDALSGRKAPSVAAIIGTERKHERYFFGRREILIPVYGRVETLPAATRKRINLVLNLTSGRRVLTTMSEALEQLPQLVGGSIFAEGLPERDALAVGRLAAQQRVWLAGGASVGVMVPGAVKLGAIGGVEASQLRAAKLFDRGGVAVVSTSGGMVNEVVRTLAASGRPISFAVAIGGERFPLLTAAQVWLAAEQDPQTEAIAHFGELGGREEYELAALLREGRVTKPVICHVAGTAAELFETPPQFGHAGAIAEHEDESARAKRAVLKEAGARVSSSFSEFVQLLQSIQVSKVNGSMDDNQPQQDNLAGRRAALITSSVSGDVDGDATVLGQDVLALASEHSFAWIVAAMLLGRPISSTQLEEFVDFVLRLLVDHGPYVSGAVTTIVTARAGRDLVSSLAAGLLTIGPRFGGAINQAAAIWLDGVQRGVTPAALVEEYAGSKTYIAGIGHRKYHSGHADPRVAKLLAFTDSLERHPYSDFARGVETVTVHKKGSLILNVDGAIACVLLDLLSQTEGYGSAQLTELIDAEFFNALFVLSRSVGFMAHFMDQRRLDEGLLRLSEDDVASAPRAHD